MASRVAHVVDGEAPESDDENDISKCKSDNTPLEASASDEGAVTASATDRPDRGLRAVDASFASNYTESILHRKLYENNVALRASVLGLFRGAVDNAFNKLSLVDQDLLNSQVRMQSAAASTTAGRQLLVRASACLGDAVSLSANTLPPMKACPNKN